MLVGEIAYTRRADIPCGQRCLKCKLETLSGPAASEFLLFLMICVVCLGVKGMMVVSSWLLSLRRVILPSSLLGPI